MKNCMIVHMTGYQLEDILQMLYHLIQVSIMDE